MMNQERQAPDVEQWIDRQTQAERHVDLSVVVPAYNEEWRLPPTLIDMIDYFDSRPISYEIIVVDDGSTDGTSTVVGKFERIRPQIRLLRVPRNYGKGHAVRTGILNAHGKLILFSDADGSSPIIEVERLERALSNGADIAIGSRALSSPETKVRARWYRRFLGRLFNWCVNMVLLPGLADTQCGFKLFRGEVAKFLFERQTSDGFSFDVEILHLARKVGLTIAEVPINWINVPGSKVNLVLDALRMLRDTIIFRIAHRHLTPQSFPRG